MPLRQPCLWLIFTAALLAPMPARAADLPPSAALGGISGHPQLLSLDCEARSAADWAAFFGTAVDELTFFDALPKTDNPNTGFVGNVSDAPGNLPPRGYGVYPPPVAALLTSSGMAAAARAGMTETELQSEIAAGRPVIVWYIYGFRTAPVYTYTANDGAAYIAASFEHTGIVIGYDPASYTVVDAFTGLPHWVNRTQFLNSWAVLGNLAITAAGPIPPAPPAPAAPAATGGQTTYYTVQRGDSLSIIARTLRVAWTDLAAWNNLFPPYTIFPGQQLIVSGASSPSLAQPLTVTAAPSAPIAQTTYTVQHGDTLFRIAVRYGLDWRNLAAWNGISWPYLIYPGQVLSLAPR